MAKVQWSAGIDSVSGALAKPSKSGQHSCEHMLLGTHRRAATTSKDCNRLYMRKKADPRLCPSVDEIEARARFAKVVAAVRTILADPTQKAALEAEYKSQTKFGSLFGYAMHKLNSNYDSNGDLIGE